MEAPQNEKGMSDHVLRAPIWVTILRGVAMLVSLIIFALCARMMHDAYLDEEGLSLAIALLTWIAILYIVLTEKIAGLNKFYNVIAVLVIDALFIILWLAAFAATASRRAKYRYAVTAGNCRDDGSMFDSKSCDIIAKRDVIMFKTGLAMFAAIAGLGAIVWLLFIATFVWTLMAYLRGRKEGRFAMSTGTANPNNNYQMENKIAEAQPMTSPQSFPPQQSFQQNPQTEYVSPIQQNYPQGQQFQQQPHPTPSPYQNQTAYPPPQGYAPLDQQQQFQGQQDYHQQQYPPQQQQAPYQQPIQPQVTGQQQYQTPPPQAVSPPPQHYQTPPPQQYQTPPPQQPQQYQQYQQHGPAP